MHANHVDILGTWEVFQFPTSISTAKAALSPHPPIDRSDHISLYFRAFRPPSLPSFHGYPNPAPVTTCDSPPCAPYPFLGTRTSAALTATSGASAQRPALSPPGPRPPTLCHFRCRPHPCDAPPDYADRPRVSVRMTGASRRGDVPCIASLLCPYARDGDPPEVPSLCLSLFLAC